MMMRLQHTRPDGEGDTYHLKPGRKFHLGRGSMCEVRILDLKLSRKHCVIEHGPRGWMIEDLGSTNGCRLDGQQIVGSAPLQVGHTIAIGQTTLRIDSLVPVEDAGENSGAQIIQTTPVPGPTRTPVPAKKDTDPPVDGRRTPLPNRTPAPTKPTRPMTPAMRTPTPGPAQEDLPGDEDDESDPRARRPTAELDANDWQPEPADA